MPHQCTNCERTFEDGSKQMLSGCPDCGGNKFQFLPAGALESQGEQRARAEAGGAHDSEDIIEAPPEPVPETAGGEDRAQASARRAVVSADELPPVEHDHGVEPQATPEAEPDSGDRPDLAQLREELNEQFESIKILRPGEYELNLMELYDRQEYIIALEEDGRYVIDVPDSWPDR